MSKDRMRSVDATIKKELANLFAKDLFPAFTCLITLADVKTTSDLKNVKVYVSIMGSTKQKREVMEYLEKHKGEYFEHLGRRIRMKFTPMIIWVFDETVEKANRIMTIINKLEIPKEDEK